MATLVFPSSHNSDFFNYKYPSFDSDSQIRSPDDRAATPRSYPSSRDDNHKSKDEEFEPLSGDPIADQQPSRKTAKLYDSERFADHIQNLNIKDIGNDANQDYFLPMAVFEGDSIEANMISKVWRKRSSAHLSSSKDRYDQRFLSLPIKRGVELSDEEEYEEEETLGNTAEEGKIIVGSCEEPEFESSANRDDSKDKVSTPLSNFCSEVTENTDQSSPLFSQLPSREKSEPLAKGVSLVSKTDRLTSRRENPRLDFIKQTTSLLEISLDDLDSFAKNERAKSESSPRPVLADPKRIISDVDKTNVPDRSSKDLLHDNEIKKQNIKTKWVAFQTNLMKIDPRRVVKLFKTGAKNGPRKSAKV